jgi:glycosyltransferase involved in cell wall biosynthesis
MKRLAIVVTHPIQYYAPVFKLMSATKDVHIKVFYTWGEASLRKYDPGFQREIEWNIPLLEGYEYAYLKNASKSPGTHSFNGIINPDIQKTLQTFDPHAILVYGWSWNSHLKVLRTFSGQKPIWFRGDSNLLDRKGGVKEYARFIFLQWVYKRVDLAFYVGTANKAYFRKFGLKEDQLKWAPHAIDNRRFGEGSSAAMQSFRDKLGIPYNATVILFAGKLEPKKDPLVLIEAFSTLANSNCYLLMVGNGVLEAAVKQKAMESTVKDRILFLDFQNQEQMPVVYQSCDLFCLPSRGPGETWGLAVNEAMAAGKAVLVSDKVGCAQDLVKEGYNGSRFQAGNVEDLQRCLANLVADSSLLKVMGKKSQEIISVWSFENQAQSILEELKKV